MSDDDDKKRGKLMSLFKTVKHKQFDQSETRCDKHTQINLE